MRQKKERKIMKVLLAYVDEFTSEDLMGRVTRMIQNKWKGAEIDKVDYAKSIEIPLDGYNAIVILGQGRFVPPVAFKRILRKLEAKKIPVYVPAEHVLFPAEQKKAYLKNNIQLQPGVCKLEQLSEKDLENMYITGMIPYMTVPH